MAKEKKLKSVKLVAIQTFDKVAIAKCGNDVYFFWKNNKDDDIMVFRQIHWKDCFIKIRTDKEDTFFDIMRTINEKIN